jgi:hypothetical protein
MLRMKGHEMLKRMRRTSASTGASAGAALPTCLPGREPGEPLLRAVGESFYQPALEAACGRRNGEEAFFDCEATLVPEPGNRVDGNAVRVEIGGRLTAYLARADASEYQPLLLELREAGYTALCRALIVGRDASDPDSQTTNLGVCLDVASAEELREWLGAAGRR